MFTQSNLNLRQWTSAQHSFQLCSIMVNLPLPNQNFIVFGHRSAWISVTHHVLEIKNICPVIFLLELFCRNKLISLHYVFRDESMIFLLKYGQMRVFFSVFWISWSSLANTVWQGSFLLVMRHLLPILWICFSTTFEKIDAQTTQSVLF